MITNKELNEVKLSPTKKDYYQIWNELLELADKISDRWSPASTNESDPGIVLLKTLTAVADKLNYNIDKNTLEAFMPSATQEESMRKLTEMMGYSMKYYQSATCKATISYKLSNDTPISEFTNGILFPRFTNLKNEDEDINYVTLQDFILQDSVSSQDVEIMEGELLECESDNDNIISMLHLDDLKRYVLPETSIAENGIFISNIENDIESLDWIKVDNLNTQLPGSKVYKFGFDSETKIPYIQFPEDISSLIKDGLRIKYIRTNGLKGNISAKVLCKLEKPALWSTADDGDLIKELSADNFTVTNSSAATNGADPESLNAAYNNYKKTIGTFDTLVTCRDYMNKIYQMTESSTNTTPLVSNVIVSDIRDDINGATQLCSFNDYGICYTNKSFLSDGEPRKLIITDGSNNTYDATFIERIPVLEAFDLVLYPFKTIYGLNNKTEYKNSFKYSAENKYKIETHLKENKNIAHNLISPKDTDIVCIKNYLQLKAKITTTRKVTYLEEKEILDKVYKAIYTSFNARQLDFGEEIPYEAILDVIRKADYRIKDLSLEEPMLYTKFCHADGTEVQLKSQSEYKENEVATNILYNKLALRNILAGKIAAFQYDTNFNSNYNKIAYPSWAENQSYSSTYNNVTKMTSTFDLAEAYNVAQSKPLGEVGSLEAGFLKLKDNQVIQFRCPNFKTTITYPAYVNYFLKRNEKTASGEDAIPATFMKLNEFMTEDRWNSFINTIFNPKSRLTEVTFDSTDKLKEYLENAVVVFTEVTENDKVVRYAAVMSAPEEIAEGAKYYSIKIDNDIVAIFNKWIKEQTYAVDRGTANYNGIYKDLGVKDTIPGVLVDEDLHAYMTTYQFSNEASNRDVLNKFYVQRTWAPDSDEVKKGLVTVNGLGKDAIYATLAKDGEYQLKSGEYLLINYTDSKTDGNGTEHKTTVNKCWREGTIIRPNFNLIDSLRYHNTHSYSKKDGFAFSGVTNPKGMFTLGTNEQIEIRERVKVNLNTKGSYLYWNLKSDNKEAETNEFIFDEDYNLNLDKDRVDENGISWVGTDKEGNSIGLHNAYTLKEGEYLYYTTNAKQDLAYYGMGSVVVRVSPNVKLVKYTSDGEISDEEIMTNGLMAAIPWIPYDLDTPKTEPDNPDEITGKIKVFENQYISLTAGDKIKSIITEGDGWQLNNDWRKITGATYKLAEEDAEATLPMISVNGFDWEARTRLDFNMSKDIDQILNEGDYIKIDYILNNNQYEQTLKSYKINNVFTPLHINSNYVCQSASDTIDIKSLEISDFKIKLSQEITLETEDPKTKEITPVVLNNYVNGNNYYTKFSFDTTKCSLNLNVNIASSGSSDSNLPFGLMMIYCTEADPEVTLTVKESSITDTVTDPETQETTTLFHNGVRRFNKANPDDLTIVDNYSNSLSLYKGINIIELKAGVSKISLSIPENSSKGTTIIFGKLDIVTGINPKLDYRLTDSEKDTNGTTDFKYKGDTLNQLLYDIRATEIVEDFYYNVPISENTAIDLNLNIEEDKLSSPLTWYDPNNANNKFVISEIDVDYLPNGITLSKSSRV